MSITITLDEAQAKLKDLVHQLEPGDEIIITENQHTVAKLVSENPHQRKPRVAGLGKGMITLITEDDEHLDGLAEYMPNDSEQEAYMAVGGDQQPAHRPPPGLGRGSIFYMATDFDEPLEEMKEFME